MSLTCSEVFLVYWDLKRIGRQEVYIRSTDTVFREETHLLSYIEMNIIHPRGGLSFKRQIRSYLMSDKEVSYANPAHLAQFIRTILVTRAN